MSIIWGIDVGGTKVEIAHFDATLPVPRLVGSRRYASRDHAGLELVLQDYAAKTGTRPTAVGVGVAGPVVSGTAKLTNLPWLLDQRALTQECGAPAFLMNDLEAHAHGISTVPEDKRLTLNAGKPRPGNAALIAAGTGLGEAVLFWDGRRHVPAPSEGSHASFGPRNQDEIELLQFLLKRFDHVSWERVVSGTFGFASLTDFLSTTGRVTIPVAWAAKRPAAGGLGPWIIDAATAGEAFAHTVLQWFVRLYGAEAGNLALKVLAVGGVFVGGGIAPRIVKELQSGAFMDGFTAKGRFRALLTDIPVYVLLDEQLALRGAAVFAAKSAGLRA